MIVVLKYCSNYIQKDILEIWKDYRNLETQQKRIPTRNTVETREPVWNLYFSISDRKLTYRSHIFCLNVSWEHFIHFLTSMFFLFNIFIFQPVFPFFHFYHWLKYWAKVNCMWFTCPLTKGNCKTFLKIYDPCPVRIFNVHKLAYKWNTFRLMWEKRNFKIISF